MVALYLAFLKKIYKEAKHEGKTFLNKIKVVLPCRLTGRTTESGSVYLGSIPSGAVIFAEDIPVASLKKLFII